MIISQNGFYDGLAHGDVSPEALREAIIKLIANDIASRGVRRLLDLGCGNGDFTLRLAKALKASEIYGVDTSSTVVETCKNKGIKTHKTNLDFEELPFPSNYFDVVVAVELIEHLINPDKMLSEVYRVLKPKGLFLLSTPNLTSWKNRILMLMGYMPQFSEPSLRYFAGLLTKEKIIRHPAGHLRLYNLRAIKELLRFYNFKLNTVKGWPAGCGNIVLNVMDKLLCSMPSLAGGIIALAQKT